VDSESPCECNPRISASLALGERIRKAQVLEHPHRVRGRDPLGDVGAPVKGSDTSVESTPKSTMDRRSVRKIGVESPSVNEDIRSVLRKR
jgi:hypothetical protein